MFLSELAAAAAAAKSLQSCPTLCDPIDGSPPGSTVPGILQARTLEWVAISFSNAWKWKVKVKSLSHVRLFVIPWTAAYQAPPSMGFSRQEYWSGVPLPSPSELATGILIVGFLSDPCASLHQYFFPLENKVSYPKLLTLIKTEVETRKRLTTNKMIPSQHAERHLLLRLNQKIPVRTEAFI